MTASDGMPPRCSARGCGQPAGWVLAWNNPSIHPPERRKTWTACDEHREHLAGFLALRGFLREIVALDEWRARGDPPGGTRPTRPGPAGP
jgi:hypothetical protein